MRLLRLAALALLLAGCGQSPSLAPSAAGGNGMRAAAIAGETLVRLKKGASFEAFAKRHPVRLVRSIGLDIYLVRGEDKALMASDAQVKWAEPNYRLSLPSLKTAPAPARVERARLDGPNDPLLPAQHAVSLTGADKVWPVQQGRSDVVVAVIDSGIDGGHPEFEGQLVPGWDFTEATPHAGGDHDGYGHGTHVAGVIGARANNGTGIAGIAPGCKLMPVRIFDDFGHTTGDASISAIIWAADHGAKVINASWGSPLPGQAGLDAFQYALDKDVVVVSAAGNSGKNDETPSFPAAYPGVIGVAATTDIDTWASFSSWGDFVSLAAPGEGILSTYPRALGNGYRIMSGTSMACPVVSAAAALVRSQFPHLTQAQVKARLAATAKDVVMIGVDPYSGSGRVNIQRAVLDPAR